MTGNAFSQLGRRTHEPPISWLMRMTLDHPGLISLAAGFTDNASLPLESARETLQHLLQTAGRGRRSLQYGSTVGDAELRERTAKRLQTLDAGGGIDGTQQAAYDPERLLITHGSQQLLYMITEALCDPGDIVLVEDPTYFVYLGIAQSHGLQCRAVRLQEDGIDLEDLDRVLHQLGSQGLLARVKMLYVVSYYQNPTGITTAFAKKTGALEILRRHEKRAGHPLYLLEDAAYRELRFQGTDTPSALAGVPDRVIYAGTYSKPFASGARVGFGLLPEELFHVVKYIKGNHDFGTSNLLQQLLVEAMRRGVYETHLTTMRQAYARKAKLMLQSLQEHLDYPGKVTWISPKGGLYVWVRLPRSIATDVNSSFFQSALQQEVLYVPGRFCYADDPSRRKRNCEMRLSFGGAVPRSIKEGIARLGAVVKRHLP